MKMKHLILVFLIGLVPSSLVHASEANQLATCLTDSLSGKERKKLAKWIYFGMSEHSTIKPHSSISELDKDTMNLQIARLLTRLLAEDCLTEAKAAITRGEQDALSKAFEVVGQVAMQELMNEPSVTQALIEYAKYLDEEKFLRMLLD